MHLNKYYKWLFKTNMSGLCRGTYYLKLIDRDGKMS